jgi:hypothetical protein
MKVRHQLKLLYFQVDKGLMFMDIISTFHIIIIIYQSFNVIFFWKIWTVNQFRTYFIHFSYIEIPETLYLTYNKFNEVLYDFKMQLK